MLLQFLTRPGEAIESLLERLEYIEAGDHVAVYGRLTGTVRKNGKRFELGIVHVWIVRNGKMTRFEAFIDTPAMLDALEE